MANPGDILRAGGEAGRRAVRRQGRALHLADKVHERQGSWWTRASSPAAPAASTTTSLRPPPSWTATTWATATSPCPSIPPAVPVNLELIQNGVTAALLAGRRHLQALLLRPLLRRRGRARQQRPVHPPHHPELPQPGGLQARRRPDVRGGPRWTPAPSPPPPGTTGCSPPPQKWTTSRPSRRKRTFDTAGL